MAKLNQIIAIEADARKHAAEALKQAEGIFGRPQLLHGTSRDYEPDKDDGDRQPSERSEIQYRGEEVLRKVQDELVKLFDVTATKDFSNCEAKADVQVDGKVLLTAVPATHLLFLEKQLTELEAFVRRFPTLDPAQRWSRDQEVGIWRTDKVQTTRTKKLPRVLVKYEATDKHPAQTEVWYEDLPVGTWTKEESSAAFPLTRVEAILGRIWALQVAVKSAREEANGLQVTNRKVGEVVLRHLFGE